MNRIAIFCASSIGGRSDYAGAARALGHALVQRGIGIVYGGGNVGLMGVVADSALEQGGEVIGVIPRMLLDKELGHTGVTELIVVETMHERKALIADRADAFIPLPGGFGTLEEFCEVLTWSQLGLHAKPCGLLNVAGFYDGLLAMFDHAMAEKLLRPEHRAIVLADQDPSRLLDRLASWRAPHVAKWIDRDTR